MSEAELIQGLQQNDPAAGRALVALHGRLVYNTALGLLQNPADAEDMAQEVFAQVFLSIAQFKGEAKLSTWLYRITVTKVLDLRRARARKKRFAFLHSLFEPDTARAVAATPDFDHPGVALENRERARVLFAAIDRLSEQQRTAFVLHKIEELPYAEVAEAMQLTVSSVESLLFRARQNLRKLLGAYYEAEGR